MTHPDPDPQKMQMAHRSHLSAGRLYLTLPLPQSLVAEAGELSQQKEVPTSRPRGGGVGVAMPAATYSC